MTRTYTRTHTHYFDTEQVDQSVGRAYKELAEDLEGRKPHMDEQTLQAAENRLEALRVAWALLLEPVP